MLVQRSATFFALWGETSFLAKNKRGNGNPRLQEMDERKWFDRRKVKKFRVCYYKQISCKQNWTNVAAVSVKLFTIVNYDCMSPPSLSRELD